MCSCRIILTVLVSLGLIAPGASARTDCQPDLQVFGSDDLSVQEWQEIFVVGNIAVVSDPGVGVSLLGPDEDGEYSEIAFRGSKGRLMAVSGYEQRVRLYFEHEEVGETGVLVQQWTPDGVWAEFLTILSAGFSGHQLYGGFSAITATDEWVAIQTWVEVQDEPVRALLLYRWQEMELVPHQMFIYPHVHPFRDLAMALSEDLLLISIRANGEPSKVPVYRYEPAQDEWVQQAELSPHPDEPETTFFGKALTIGDGILFVSDSGVLDHSETRGRGHIYVFESQDGQWVETNRLILPNAGPDVWSPDRLAVQDDRLLVQTERRSYVFVREAGGWRYRMEREAGSWMRTAAVSSNGELWRLHDGSWGQGFHIFRSSTGSEMIDCNFNGLPDSCDIANGTSTDTDGDGVPDECQYDCAGAPRPDIADISGGTIRDCNGNAYSSACDITLGFSLDANANGVPDDCEILDCDGDGVTDAVEFQAGTVVDCNDDGFDDDCAMTGGVRWDGGEFTATWGIDGKFFDGEMMWANQYDAGDGLVIGAIRIAFHSYSDVESGIPLHLYLWDDPDGDRMPEDAVARLHLETEVQPGLVPGLTWQDYPIAPIRMSGSLFVGASARAEIWPAAAGGESDFEPNIERAWYTIGTDPALEYPMVPSDAPWWLLRLVPLDCNGNGVPDTCDIAEGLLTDANGNGVPDDCDCSGELGGDGQVDVFDLLDLLGRWGPCAADCIGDLNGDRMINVLDLLDLLAHWGPCPTF